MAVYAQERSILLKNSAFSFFDHLEFKYQKVTKVQSCTKFDLQTFLASVKKTFYFIKIWVRAWFYKNAKKPVFKSNITDFNYMCVPPCSWKPNDEHTFFYQKMKKKFKNFNMYFCKLAFSEFHIFPDRA